MRRVQRTATPSFAALSGNISPARPALSQSKPATMRSTFGEEINYGALGSRFALAKAAMNPSALAALAAANKRGKSLRNALSSKRNNAATAGANSRAAIRAALKKKDPKRSTSEV